MKPQWVDGTVCSFLAAVCNESCLTLSEMKVRKESFVGLQAGPCVSSALSRG